MQSHNFSFDILCIFVFFTIGCDAWMNLDLREVIRTSADGATFHKMPECYIRGSSVKVSVFFLSPQELIEFNI